MWHIQEENLKWKQWFGFWMEASTLILYTKYLNFCSSMQPGIKTLMEETWNCPPCLSVFSTFPVKLQWFLWKQCVCIHWWVLIVHINFVFSLSMLVWLIYLWPGICWYFMILSANLHTYNNTWCCPPPTLCLCDSEVHNVMHYRLYLDSFPAVCCTKTAIYSCHISPAVLCDLRAATKCHSCKTLQWYFNTEI